MNGLESTLVEFFDEFDDPSDIGLDSSYGRYDAWTPPYDNYNGKESFWTHYELSLLND